MAEHLGKYELLQVLGRGAMGTVYEGFDPIISRRLAIKTVRVPDVGDTGSQQEALARFKREAQAAGRLSHPNIVGVFDYGETSELAYIIMEFVDGTTLKHVVDKKERFELREIVRLMEGILTGLQYSHDRGVVHRDVKPATIMLTQAGEVKIADFGIARIESSSMTQAGAMLGTPSYMSPEQFMGQTVDARTDIYSAGVLLYQLLTGEKPFEGGLTAIMHKVLNSEPLPPSTLSVNVPPAFDAVVLRAMAKRPAGRFQTATEFATAIRNAFENKDVAPAYPDEGDATVVASGTILPPRPGVPSVPRPAEPPKKGAPVAILGALAVVVALLAGGAFVLLKPSGGTPAPAVTQAAPTPPPAPAPPPMTQADRESTLTATLGALPCTFLSATDSASKALVSGIAGVGEPQAALSGALGSLPAGLSVNTNVQTIEGPYCDALDAIRPYHSLFTPASMQLGLNLAGGKTTLHAGDLISITNKLPGFSGYLETDYFSADGTVYHAYQAKHGAKPEPAGDAKTTPLGTVAAPFGTDMILSIASSSPLFAAPRADDENASDYLPALRGAMQDVATAGGNVAVAAIPVVTEPK